MNPKTIDHVRDVLRRADARMRENSICPTCQKPRRGIQFPDPPRKGRGRGPTVPSRQLAGLCICPGAEASS